MKDRRGNKLWSDMGIKHKKMKHVRSDIKRKRMKNAWLDMKSIRWKLPGMVSALSVILMLGGCTLAREDAGTESGQDRLIGVFITTEYLDLFDFDVYLSDHVGTLMSGGEHIVTDSSGYEGKMYADIDKHGSAEPEDWEVSFGDVDGMNCFVPLWENTDGESFHASQMDEKVCDVDLKYTVTDDGEDMEMSVGIYIIPMFGHEEQIYYPNPVYQTEGGEIYAVPGQGFMMNGEMVEGQAVTTEISASSSDMENGKAKTENVALKIAVSVKFEPIRITLFQMSEDNQILKSDDYIPGTLPEKIQAEKGTAYFLIQTEKTDPEGGSAIMRDIYEYDKDAEDALETFYVMEHGILRKQYTEIVWDTEQEG